jgi:hypothetical protein
MLAVDFYLTGMPVYVIEELHAPDWLPGTLLAVSTTLSSLAGTFALRMTGRLTRIAAIQAGAVLYVAWCAVSLAAILLPPAWRPADLMMAIVLLAAAGLVCGPARGRWPPRWHRRRPGAVTWPRSSTRSPARACSRRPWPRWPRSLCGCRGCWWRPERGWRSGACSGWPAACPPTR